MDDFKIMLYAQRERKYRFTNSSLSEAVRDLISNKLLDPNPETRASIDKVVEHPWFPSVIKDMPQCQAQGCPPIDEK